MSCYIVLYLLLLTALQIGCDRRAHLKPLFRSGKFQSAPVNLRGNLDACLQLSALSRIACLQLSALSRIRDLTVRANYPFRICRSINVACISHRQCQS